MTDELEQDEQRPSRSARKRAAESAQELGERLIALPDAELTALGLPERLVDAVREARRITSRAAGARQRQYIGKLMRDIDHEPIAAALAARSERDALEAQRFARAESWRDRLLAEGEAALTELAARHPSIDLDEWRGRIARARTEQTGAARAAQRELFRALRALLG
ncbi:MAG: ribosome biogenesis factor YjgA [Gammaproteobacteria bacterium]